MSVKVLTCYSRGEMAETTDTGTDKEIGSCVEDCEEAQTSSEESMVALGELKNLFSSRLSNNNPKSTTPVETSRKAESSIALNDNKLSLASYQKKSANEDMNDQHQESGHSKTRILLKSSMEPQGFHPNIILTAPSSEFSPQDNPHEAASRIFTAHPMQAAQVLFQHAKDQVHAAEALHHLQGQHPTLPAYTAAATLSPSTLDSSLALFPSYPLIQPTNSMSSNLGAMNYNPTQQLSRNMQLVDNFLAMRNADLLMAQQIRISAGLPLDPLTQSLLAHYLQHQATLPRAPTSYNSLPPLGGHFTPSIPFPSADVSVCIPVGLGPADHDRRLILYISSDDNVLAENQIAIRRNIELFEATQADVDTSVSGRRKPLVVGQVGIQCVHCSIVPIKQRKKGARYYPAKLDGIYQAAQNMAYCHLAQSCDHIDYNAKSKLLSFQRNRSNGHGGKSYWSQTARAQGIFETERFGLKFA